MRTINIQTCTIIGSVCLLVVQAAHAASSDQPYRILKTAQTMGTGGIDYVFADSDGRRLYIPRGAEVLVFDLDTLKSTGSIPNARARGGSG